MGILSLCLFLQVLVPAGTRVEARLESVVETATSNLGDPIMAVLSQPIRAGGNIVVPEGSRLNGRVETVVAATQTSEGRVRLVFREIEFSDGRKVSTWITDSFSASSPNRKRRYPLYMGIGAGAGALIGGKNARVAGVLGGLLLGFVLASNAADAKLPDLVLKPNSRLHLRLGEDLKL
jgi:hypothetical protein